MGTHVVATIILLVLTMMIGVTRLASGKQERSARIAKENDVEPPMLPYWLPFIGHLPDMILRPDELFTSVREHKAYKAFAINLFGYRFNITWSPEIVRSIFSQRHDVLNTDAFQAYCIHTIGGIPHEYAKVYKTALAPLMHEHSTHLTRMPEMNKMFDVTSRLISENTPNLVTFTRFPIDQMPWEKVSNADVSITETGPCVEVNLLQLVINFIAHGATPAIFGTDLIRNYPDLFQWLWDFNSGFFLLAAGLPWWLPIPILQRAYRGRARLLEALEAQQRAMDAFVEGRDPGILWNNIDDVSAMLWDRHAYYRKCGIPARARADLTILWAANANSNFLVFWLLIRIYSAPQLLARLREEMAPYVEVDIPTQEFRLAEAPRIKIDEKGLISKCPLLKACYIESLRLDSSVGSVRSVAKDLTIRTNGEDDVPYLFKAGTFILIPQGLHFTDPDFFAAPTEFRPDRHISQSTDELDDLPKAQFGTLQPFGGGSGLCPGRFFAEREVLSAVAAVLALWDIEPMDKKGWKIPEQIKASGVAIPKRDVRVRISRRAGVWS